MRARYATGVTLLMLTACGGGDSTSDDLGEAFCADLESGLGVAQILADAPADMFDSPLDAAANVSLYTEDHCPQELETNEGLRSFLDANGIDPDNLDG